MLAVIASPRCTSAIREPDDARTLDVSTKQLAQFLAGHRNAEVEALADVASGLAQMLQLRGGFDALADNFQAERAAERDDRFRDRATAAAAAKTRNEASIDLENVDGEPLEAAQRRVAGTEVIDRQKVPALAEGLQRGQRCVGSMHRGTLGQLQLETIRLESDFRRQPVEHRDQTAGAHLHGRDVDGQMQTV